MKPAIFVAAVLVITVMLSSGCATSSRQDSNYSAGAPGLEQQQITVEKESSNYAGWGVLYCLLVVGGEVLANK